MSTDSQIYLLGKTQPGLGGVLERLVDVGYKLRELQEGGTDDSGIAILCIGRETNFDELAEELVRMRRETPRLEWIALFTGRLKTKAHTLHAMGFEQIYQIPLDEDLFTNRIFERVPIVVDQKNLKFEHLLRVNVPVLKDLKRVPFDIFVYLPSNRRIMLYLREGVALDSAQLERFEKHKNYPLFIRKTNIAQYKELSGRALLKIKDQVNLAEDAKVELVQEHVQNLMNPFFSEGELSDDEGRQTVAQLQQMLRGLQISPTLEEETIVSLERLSAQKMTNASHSNNVATYCALFGLALGLQNIDELRLGGLLHDVGLADLPVDLIGQSEESMSDEDRARYHLHPGNGKTDVLNRNVPVTETVLNMILFHHERPDGSGYPYGKKGDEIPIEAQICAFADEFDKWTSLRAGYRCYSPRDAMLLLSGQLGERPASVFNPDVHQRIVDFYLAEKASASTEDREELGQVQVEDRSQKGEQASQSMVSLRELASRLSPPPLGALTIPDEIRFEVMALEKELEFYFMENGF